MALKPLILTLAVSLGAAAGWRLGSSAGLMTAYLCAVTGASLGIYLGRKIQRALDGD